jgi:hypothetical protein
MVTVKPIDSSRLPQVTALQQQQADTDAAVAVVQAKLINYSTTEQDTGLTYTAAQPVFQKTLTGITGPKNSTVTRAHGISGLTRILSCDCWGTDTVNHGGAPFVGIVAALNLQINADGTNVYLTDGVGSDYSGFLFDVTLRYLK